MGKNAKNWNTGKKDQMKIGAKKIQDPGFKKILIHNLYTTY